jgi:membrane protein implicated in regulation of membrane protease activity
MIKTFWDKNKVFILGLLGAIALAIEPFAANTSDDVKWKVVGFAVLVAVLSYFAKEWRGQGLSIIGILGNTSAVFVTVWNTGHFTWNQFILQLILAILTAAGADPKSRGYEKAEVIKEAKKEGEQINPAQLTTKSKV